MTENSDIDDLHYLRLPSSYDGCKAILTDLLSTDKVSEIELLPGIVEQKEDERLVQYIWHEQFLKKDLRTVSGKSLVVVDTGRWNFSAGADFKNAQVIIDGKKIKGDVEIHFNSSGWTSHSHNQDFEYNSVVLHAYLFSDDSKQTDALQNSSLIERLEMNSFLFPDLETIKRTVSPEDYTYRADIGAGKCAVAFDKLRPDFLARFFGFAGRERIKSKVKRIERQLYNESYDQVLYQSIMTAMGYKKSKSLFFLLAKRTPISEVLDYIKNINDDEKILAVQSILLHTANLIPPPETEASLLDKETMIYIDHLNRHWAEIGIYFRDRIIPVTKNWHSQMRPVNFPSRRLAGMSYLILAAEKSGGLIEKFLKAIPTGSKLKENEKSLKILIKTFIDMIVVDKQDYWSKRYTFTGKKSSRELKLIGTSAAMSIAFNSVLPVLISYFQQTKEKEKEKLVWKIADVFPPLSENVVTGFMKRRLFSDLGKYKTLKRSEKNQQALFQIFYDCCSANEVNCDNCTVLRSIE